MGDHVHRWLAVVVLAIAITAFLGWRSLGSASSPRAGPSPNSLPSPQLTQLMPYSQPLGNTVGLLHVGHDNIDLPRDPFGRQVVQQASQNSGGEPSSNANRSGRVGGPWRVTATMIAGARRAAVINDMLIYVGDSLPGGGKLTSVERDRVIVTEPNGTSHVVAVKEGDT